MIRKYGQKALLRERIAAGEHKCKYILQIRQWTKLEKVISCKNHSLSLPLVKSIVKLLFGRDIKPERHTEIVPFVYLNVAYNVDTQRTAAFTRPVQQPTQQPIKQKSEK